MFNVQCLLHYIAGIELLDGWDWMFDVRWMDGWMVDWIYHFMNKMSVCDNNQYTPIHHSTFEIGIWPLSMDFPLSIVVKFGFEIIITFAFVPSFFSFSSCSGPFYMLHGSSPYGWLMSFVLCWFVSFVSFVSFVFIIIIIVSKLFCVTGFCRISKSNINVYR